MKTLLSAVLLLALAVPVVHAQDTHCLECYETIIGFAGTGAPAQDTTTIISKTRQMLCGTPGYIYAAGPCQDSTLSLVISQALEDGADAHYVRPTTLPSLDFSWGRRLVHVSGVAMADGQPVPGAKVNVIAGLEGGFNKYQLAVADARGVYNAWFKAPAAIRTVTVDVQSFCSTGNDLDCSDSYSWLGSEGAEITGTDSY